MEKVQFMPEGEDRPVDFYVLEETKLAGRQYLLVTDSEEGDGEALILRADPAETGTMETKPAGTGAGETDRAGTGTMETDPDSTYEIVEDENELSAVLLMMRDRLEEIGIEIEI